MGSNQSIELQKDKIKQLVSEYKWRQILSIFKIYGIPKFYKPNFICYLLDNAPGLCFLNDDFYNLCEFCAKNEKNIDKADAEGNALIRAVQYEKHRVAKILLKNGANPNCLMNESEGISPLTMACSLDDMEMIDILLSHNANPDTKDKSGKRPFYNVSHCYMNTFRDLLIKHGFSLDNYTKDKKNREDLVKSVKTLCL